MFFQMDISIQARICATGLVDEVNATELRWLMISRLVAKSGWGTITNPAGTPLVRQIHYDLCITFGTLDHFSSL